MATGERPLADVEASLEGSGQPLIDSERGQEAP